tara:strand:- start:1983 stop:2453 length:471 start_codon:yes stop_codon:yes gene_type:complete
MIDPKDFFKFIEPIKDEDFKQDMYLKLLELAPKFKGTKEDFERYLNKTLFFKRKDFIIEKIHKADAEAFSLNETTEYGTDIGEFIEDSGDLQSELESKDMLGVIQRSIPIKEYAILELFHKLGLTAEEIIEQYPDLDIKNTKQVYNIIAKHKVNKI